MDSGTVAQVYALAVSAFFGLRAVRNIVKGRESNGWPVVKGEVLESFVKNRLGALHSRRPVQVRQRRPRIAGIEDRVREPLPSCVIKGRRRRGSKAVSKRLAGQSPSRSAPPERECSAARK